MQAGTLAGKRMRPGGKLGVYPQRLEQRAARFERWADAWLGGLRVLFSARRYRMARLLEAVDQQGEALGAEGVNLGEVLETLRYRLHREGFTDELVYRAFALVRKLASRELGIAHYPTQLLGGWIILNGKLAEMDTGEGKSLTATLPAATAALAGVPVHVVTTNEYLASRDAEAYRPLYEALGLRVSAVVASMDTAARREAYKADIVYLTNQQLVFDYLRDRLASGNASGRLALKYGEQVDTGELVLRGLCFAILDEADSVLVDEARTPLILSRDHPDTMRERIYTQALDIARSLEADVHFEVRGADLALTDAGRQKLIEETGDLGGLFSGRRHSEFLVRQALVALHSLKRDHHYLVRNDKVEIIDQNTGRLMADRSWQQGLHQMVECKEGCPVTGQRETLASISYQRFFRRYLHVGGMSGTLEQVRRELRSVYGLAVLRVPNYRPSRRRQDGVSIYPRASNKWLAVLSRVQQVNGDGRPALVGTRSLHDSDLLGRLFSRRGLRHRILNARQDKGEAEVVARAGQAGQVTVATNMAGRGTDIKLGPGITELGGLHVIATDANEELRIDRQLFGRCARQGDPGSCEWVLSLEDDLFVEFYPGWLLRGLERVTSDSKPLGGAAARCLAWLAQRGRSEYFRRQREELLHHDERLERALAYSGRGD